MVKILVMGQGAREIEAELKEATRAVEGELVVVVVRLATSWMISFPVSPKDVLLGASWFGPQHRLAEIVRGLLNEYGLVPPTPAPALKSA